MKKTLLAAILTLALVVYSSAQEPSRGTHQGETFELRNALQNDDDHTYTANNYIKLLPGFKSKPETEKTSLLQLGLDPLGIYSPNEGYTNDSGNVVGSLGGTVSLRPFKLYRKTTGKRIQYLVKTHADQIEKHPTCCQTDKIKLPAVGWIKVGPYTYTQ